MVANYSNGTNTQNKHRLILALRSPQLTGTPLLLQSLVKLSSLGWAGRGAACIYRRQNDGKIGDWVAF